MVLLARTPLRRPADTDSRTSAEPEVVLVADAEAITHATCCRDTDWSVAVCGAAASQLNPAAEVVCSMCVEEILRLCPDALDHDPPLCFRTREPCPDAHEVDLEILRRASP